MTDATEPVTSSGGSVTTVSGTSSGRGAAAPRPEPRLSFTGGLVLKLVLLAVVNAVALWGIQVMLTEGKVSWAIPAAVALVALDIIYLSQRRFIPGKYLYPGTFFLVAFALYPVAYNVFISFTNYGTGNIQSKAQAINTIEQNSIVPPGPDAPRYKLQVMAQGDPATGELGFFLTADDGEQGFGTADGLEPVDPAEVQTDGERVTAYKDFSSLNLREVQNRKTDLEAFTVPVEGGYIKNEGFTTARVVQQRLVYDPTTNTMVDQVDGTVYVEQAGNFVTLDADGNVDQSLDPGWRAVVGFDNYKKLFTDDRFRDSFTLTFVWTFVFSILSVVTTFVLGLALALVFNSEKMKGRRFYRSLIIVPYALPSFMTALVWKGMMNTTFGIINKTFGWAIPWLDGTQGVDRFWPYFSILLVNLWLGYPYMFLVTTGALQGIPSDLKEAAFVDGARPFTAFRKVVFPLLLIAVAPLLISSFAFNFNNFNLIYLLTEGKPPIPGSDIGRTDILISAAWKIAFGGGRGADYGLACAISVIIFFIVATISALSFRLTRTFEEVK